MTEFELDEEIEDDDEYDAFIALLPDKIKNHDKAIEKLIDQVARLANKLEEHMNEPDAHHVAMLAKKQSL